MNLIQKIGASAGVVALNILSCTTVGYLADRNSTVVGKLFGPLTLMAGITVVLDKYVNQNIISNKGIQYALTAVEGLMFLPIVCLISGGWDKISKFLEMIINTDKMFVEGKLQKHACMKFLISSIIIQALAFKYIWDQDDSSNTTDDITTELEIGQMDELQMVAELQMVDSL